MPDTNPTTTTTATAVDPSGPEALARAREEAARIPHADLLPIRVDVANASMGAIGSMPAIEKQRAALVATFGAEGAEAIDQLVPAARLAMLANAALTAAAERDLEPAAKALMEKRVRLFTLASAMVARGIVHKKTLSGLEGGQGYVALVTDTLALRHWFEKNAAVLAPHSKVTTAELDAVQLEAEEFGRALMERDQARAGTTRDSEARARAFTHFVRVYEQVRKLITFVRWTEGDCEQIAPSLYAGRARKGADADDELGPLTPPSGPAIAPGMPGASPFGPNS